MGTTALQAIALATSGIVAFGSMTLVILLLMSPWRWRSGLAYAVGYMEGYLLQGLMLLAIGARATTGEPPTTEPRWLAVLWSLLGLFLLWLAWRNARRPTAPTHTPPRFFRTVEAMNPRRSFMLGLLVTIINIKNVGLFLSAQSIVVLSPLSTAAKIGLTVAVVFVFSGAVWLPLLIYALAPHRATETLSRIKTWLETHSRPLSIWAPFVFGIIFLIKGGKVWL